MERPVSSLSQKKIGEGIRGLGLSGKPVCVHSSFRSLGPVEGGPAAVLGAFLEEGCTLLVPTFSYAFEADPPQGNPYPQNAFTDKPRVSARQNPEGYSRHSQVLDSEMGIFSASVLGHPGSLRGGHPLDSFTALGPLAGELIAGQDGMDIYAPLRKLREQGGFIALLGVGLDKMTFVHLAEETAGRNLFRRWAWGPEGGVVETRVGGCSDGFVNLEGVVAPLMRNQKVGQGLWKVYPAVGTLEILAGEIRRNPAVTHCANGECGRCNDAVKGGPVLPGA